jgi:SAM-dependent methyltransferase
MACGTGNVAIPLAENGFKLIGLDRSPTMLAELRKKDKTRRIQLICADMRDFSLPEPVDACICLFDSLNYLLTIEELASCFCSVRNSLKPDGIFIFDMNTLYCLANYWSNQVSVREFGDVYSIWQSRYDPERHISTLYLTLFVRQRNHKYKRFEEVHKERGYELSEIRENLNRAGFPKVNIYHHLTFEPPTPLTSRVMVVAEPYVSDLG